MSKIEKLKERGCKIIFSSDTEMRDFLSEMDSKDIVTHFKTAKIETRWDSENNHGIISSEGTIYPFWDFAIPTLEERSGDNAVGHKMMSTEQILNSMNNYWKLNKKNESSIALIRGGKLMALHSNQYDAMPQIRLFETLMQYLKSKPTGYQFIKGFYSHEMTEAEFSLPGRLSKPYIDAWIEAGLSKELLSDSMVGLSFRTNDIGTSKATVTLFLKIRGDVFLLGEPIEIKHRKGCGTIEDFERKLNAIDDSVTEELLKLSSLMSIRIVRPESACIRAIKKAGLPKISMKASKELTQDMFFTPGTSAYVIYLFLNGFNKTSFGSTLSKERKFRAMTSIRRLLNEDWTKFDKAGPITL